ncbi:MAG: hypothetical protein Q8P62_02590 [Candidatus Peregrinibacteria bacterium]|nr:hypothetical protein [Candidatus Peregrinibacteria bacterium]
MIKKKILYFGGLVAILIIILTFSSNGSFFQGRLGRNPLPAYDETKCYDSDGGKNYEELGTTRGAISRSEYGNKTDFCNATTQLTEYYCDGGIIKNQTHDCDEGCISGKCESDLQINISDSDIGKSFDLKYSNYLSFPDGVKTYFGYYDFDNNGEKEFVVYSKKMVDGKEYLLTTSFIPLEYFKYMSYEISLACPKLKITGKKANENEFTIDIVQKKDLNDKYCIPEFIDSSGKSFDFSIYEDGKIKYYFDKDMFENENIKNSYFSMLKNQVNESYEFIKKNLGTELIYLDKINYIAKLNPTNFPYSGSFGSITDNGGTISDNYLISIAKEGNINPSLTHEFIHVFLNTSPVDHSWFEEGMANYMGDLHSSNKELNCYDSAWEIGNSGLVPYSNFSKSPVEGTSYNDSSSMSSYYRSAQCFWNFIEQNYGNEFIGKIVKAWFGQLLSKGAPVKMDLIKGIITPTLGVDLSSLAKTRYNYIE